MASQKIENLLNLALDASPEERARSSELEVGFNPIDKEWDLIVKYSGSLEQVRAIANRVMELLNEYAIISIQESLIPVLASFPQIEFIEKPKLLFFQVLNGKRVSCIDAVQDTRFSLFGQGILVAVIDSGIDYTLPDFRNADGTTRIRSMWDQSLNVREGERPPEGFEIGVEYSEEQINEALKAGTPQARRELVATQDITGHGTAVTGIAAGNGQYAGVAPKSELLIVKMANPRGDGFPRTSELMMGIDYVVRKSIELKVDKLSILIFGAFLVEKMRI